MRFILAASAALLQIGALKIVSPLSHCLRLDFVRRQSLYRFPERLVLLVIRERATRQNEV
jgi:hypothetical protein